MIYPDIKHHSPAPGRPPRWIGQWKTTIESPKGNAKINSLYSTVHIRLIPLMWNLLLHTRQAWQAQTRLFGPLVRFYRLRENEPRHWCFTVHFGRWGYTGFRMEISFKSSHAGASVYLGSRYSESDFRLHVGVPYLMVYLSGSGCIPHWVKPASSRRISLDFHNYTLWWAFWASGSFDSQSDRKLSKWRKGNWNYADFFFGPIQIKRTQINQRHNVPIAMPEDTYRATVTMHKVVITRSRWPLPIQQFTVGTVELVNGIPIPSKWTGTTFCDYSSGPAKSMAEAIAKMIQHVTEKRGVGGDLVESN